MSDIEAVRFSPAPHRIASESDGMKDHAGAIAALFAVPPFLLGIRVEPRTREDAAREALAYVEAMGMSPFDIGDSDVELVACADHAYECLMVDVDEWRLMLAPLRAAPVAR